MYKTTGRECFFYILRKWKIMLSLGIIVGILLGGYTLAKTIINWDRNKSEIEEAQAAYDEMTLYLSGVQDFYNKQIDDKQRLLEEYRSSLDSNPILSYDSTNIGMAYADIVLDAFNSDGSAREITDDYLNVFRTVVEDNLDWEAIAQNGNLDEEYVKDLYGAWYWGSTNRMMRVRFYSDNETKATAMLEEYLAQAEAMHDLLVRQMGEFEMSSLNILSRTDNDGGFASIQQNILNKVDGYQGDIDALNETIAGLPYPAVPPQIPTPGKIVLSVGKHAAVGFGAVVVALIVLYYLLFYLNGRLHSTSESEYYSGSAAISYEPDSKKKNKGIDKWIASMDTKTLLYPQAEAVHRVLLNAKLVAPEAEKIMFTGLDSDKEIQDLKNILTEIKGMSFKFGLEKNLLTNRESLDHLAVYDAVVLVEKLDKTDVELLKKEIELIRLSGKKIVGVLMVR
ncbi:MAG: hypothetical protein J5685_04495 [Clostridiales bacterium]|nr:hypothetical protein [Clostridiales bacterium]